MLVLPKPTNSISFNFPNFANNDPRINFQGDSIRNGSFIEVTRNNAGLYKISSVGRAIYSEAIQLWDATTGRMTDFETHFSFIIDAHNATMAGDGMAFFLAPFGSILPPYSWGGSLALLTSNVSQKNLATNQIVAVEFDTYKNTWDASSDHIGINVNSVVSVATEPLAHRSIRDGRKANAWVTYNSATTNLSVLLSYDEKPIFIGSWESSSLYHVVDLSKVLPEQVTVGFSAATGVWFEDHKILSWKFNSTLELIHKRRDNKTGEGQPDINGEGNKTGLAVGLGVGFGVFGFGIGFVLFIWWKNRHNSRKFPDDAGNNAEFSMNDIFEKTTGPKRFSYRELVNATNNFDEGGKLGEGGFGGVYKGFLSDISLNIAVKKISSESKQGKREYQAEVQIISQLRHRNLVQLRGWCHEKKELLLVYEFMPYRSLDKHLFRRETVLTWDVRYKIALGLASALSYLHEAGEQCVVHRDIKSSNVMLDTYFNAKLGDFGLARLVDHGKRSETTKVAGTRGYLAPECYTTGKFSKESDIYSFGIVALEIACGRKPVETDKVDLVEWVRGLYRSGKIIEAADEILKLEFNELEMEHLLVVGLWCSHPDSELRPSATQVINVLKFESPLPKLPLELPTFAYQVPAAPSVPNLSSSAGLNNSSLTGR
ncbi:hypothetical protein C5167_039809 [Papaver somniferum]|uniref:non-specific serine/threonine protein kinase n=1 Tax=Papaver somniferum TaxID=3469 RepID=A0A4Y7IGL1_PAPSO|nr:L-type lectin-domain containing receptor kinase IX.1-like [Papaver somniferum]RZC46850.1 hypothetical protein C5167_039809 [Papaver somniferum]